MAASPQFKVYSDAREYPTLARERNERLSDHGKENE